MKRWLLNNLFLLVTALVAVYGAVLATLNALQRRERVSIKRVFPGKVSTLCLNPRVEIVNTVQDDVPVRTVIG